MDLHLVEIVPVIVFFIGFYGLIAYSNMIKSVASLGVMEAAAIVFFLGLGYRGGMKPPIGPDMVNTADPLPQALVITAIIMGVAVTAVNLTMLLSLCRQENSIDWCLAKRKSGSE